MTMPSHAARDSGATLKGRDVLIVLVAFFGVVFAVNGYFLYVALATHGGVVANEPYRKGLAYNDRIAADDRQIRLGWTADVQVDRGGRVQLALTDRNGAPVSGVRVGGTIGRPATSRSDLTLVMREVEPGRYAADGAAFAAGSWIVLLDIDDRQAGSEPTYRLRRRVWLKP